MDDGDNELLMKVKISRFIVMKRVLLSYLLLQMGLISVLISCNEDSDSAPIDIDIVTLNSRLEQESHFASGDKIYFAFKIRNASVKDIVWYNYCDIFQNKNVYSVFKLVDETQNYNYIGAPLSPPIECNDVPTILSIGDGYYLSVPWDKNAGSPTLTVGSYICKFSLDIKINDYKKISKSFDSTFEIK